MQEICNLTDNKDVTRLV